MLRTEIAYDITLQRSAFLIHGILKMDNYHFNEGFFSKKEMLMYLSNV